MVHVCKECGIALPGASLTKGGRVAEYCSAEHRRQFNNRRALRGAQLVDLLMTDYTDRTHPARKNGLLQKAARRLLSRWRDEDRAAGRAHCGDVNALLQNDPPLTKDYEFYMGGNPWSGARKRA
jgi:hypothetical protein